MGWGTKQTSQLYVTDGDTGEIKSVNDVWVREKTETINETEQTTDVLIGRSGESEHDHTYKLNKDGTGKVNRVNW
jgi:hypothetical protein